MPDSIEISQLLKKSVNESKEVCTQYNKGNPVGSRFYVSCVKMKTFAEPHVSCQRLGENWKER